MAASAPIDELRHRYAAQPRRFLAPLANALRESGALEEAVTMLRAQLAEYPDHLTGHVVLGQALFDTGALADATTAFETARTLDPGNRVVLRQLGEIASLAGDRDMARLWFERLRAAEPYADDVEAQLGGGPSEPLDVEPPVRGTTAIGPAQEVGGDPVADGFVAEPIASEPFELLDFEAPALDPVVGLDVAPAAPPAELEHVLDATHDGPVPDDTSADEVSPNDASARDHIATGAFATETMAGLLAAQGHTQQAVALYERLVAERPGDVALRARLDALRGGPTLVGPAPEAASDSARGALLAAGFADLASARAAVPTADADPYADLSFDRFFAAPESRASATVASPPVATDGATQPSSATGDDDLARFDAWLRELA